MLFTPFTPSDKPYIGPVEFPEAKDFVARYHRHGDPPTGHKFSLGLYLQGNLIGVAVLSRPKARGLDKPGILEITRLCTLGHRNACSMLYGACQRYARHKGYQRLITYTLLSESAGSVRGANFFLEAANVGAKVWRGKRNARTTKRRKAPPEKKNRWGFVL